MAYYGITNSNQIIDKDKIISGCGKIDKEAQYFRKAAEVVDQASSILNRDALSVDKATMQSTVEDVADALRQFETAVNNATASIEGVASQVYRDQSSEYSAYLQAEREKAKAAAKSNK